MAEKTIAINPNNLLAYNLAIGAKLNQKKWEDARILAQTAIQRFADSKELNIKLAAINNGPKSHEEAAKILLQLRKMYP